MTASVVMSIIGGIRRGAIGTWRFVSPVYWDGFHRIRVPERSDIPGSVGEQNVAEPSASALTVEVTAGSAHSTSRKPQWKAPNTQPTHDSVPVLSLHGSWTACKDLASPNSNEDAFLWVAERQVAAVFDGATESFAARRWVRIIRNAWKLDSPIDLAALQKQYSDDISLMSLSWAQEHAVGRGSFTTIASIQPAPGGLSATCVGDSAILLAKDGCVVQAFPSLDSTAYSSVPDALGSSSVLLESGRELLDTCTWVIPVYRDEIDMVVLATDAVAVWLLQGNGTVPDGRLAAALAIEKTHEWEQLVATERDAGRMKPDDSTVMIIDVGGSG